MASWLPHLVIPLLLGLAILPHEKRQVILVAPVVWLADLDYAIQSVHRAATHSILMPLGLLAAAILLWRRRDPSADWREFLSRPGWPGGLTLSAYYLASHLALDLFQGGVVPLWPFSITNLHVRFTLWLDTANNTFSPSGAAGASEGVPTLSPFFPWISSLDTAIGAFILASLAAWLALRRRPHVVRVEATPLKQPDE